MNVPWDGPHILAMAKAAISGVQRRGGEVEYLQVHPEDWNMLIDYARRTDHIPSSTKPELAIAGYPVWLTEWQARGDVRAFGRMVI